MKLICPNCERPFELGQAIRELEHREIADLAGKFGKAWPLVFEYSESFRQSEYGSVPLKKRLRIFKEVGSLFDALNFSVKGKKYRTDWNTVVNAMTEICNLQKWGFRNHNYLKAVLVKGSDRLSAEGMTAREETAREVGSRQSGVSSRQEGVSSRQESGVAARDGDMTADEFCRRHGVKSLGEILKR